MGGKAKSCEVELDLSPLLVKGKRLAVHCKTKEDAIHLLKCLTLEYPERCIGWATGETHFGQYRNMCYCPRLNTDDILGLTYCSVEHFEELGYTIIPFEELLVCTDINESERSLDFLFGGTA